MIRQTLGTKAGGSAEESLHVNFMTRSSQLSHDKNIEYMWDSDGGYFLPNWSHGDMVVGSIGIESSPVWHFTIVTAPPLLHIQVTRYQNFLFVTTLGRSKSLNTVSLSMCTHDTIVCDNTPKTCTPHTHTYTHAHMDTHTCTRAHTHTHTHT